MHPLNQDGSLTSASDIYKDRRSSLDEHYEEGNAATGLFENTWEVHQNLADMMLPLTETSGGVNHFEADLIAGAAAISHAVSSLDPMRRRNSAAPFVNSFFPTPNLATVNPQMTNYEKNVVTEEDEEDEEACDQVYQNWNGFNPNTLTPHMHPINLLAMSTGEHPAHLMYNNPPHYGGNQMQRRFSLACPPTTAPFELPSPIGPHGIPSNLQFVMENPSLNADGSTTNSCFGPIDSSRRHSLGAPHLYCCPWTGCNKVFNRFYNLRSHYRIHSGEKPFTCNYCEAAFARNHDLKRHERIHLKTKPFVCPTCNKSFSRNDAMNRHIRLNSCARTSS